MADLDTLEIQIESDAKKAVSNLDNLSKKIGDVANKLDLVKSKGNFNALSNSISQLSVGMKRLKDANIGAGDYSKITRGLSKFESLNSVKITDISKAITPLATAIRILGQSQFDGKGVNSFVNSIAKLSGLDFSNINTSSMSQVANAIKTFATSVQGMEKLPNGVIGITNALGRLGQAGANMPMTVSNLGALTTELRKSINVLNSVGSVSDDIVKFTQAIAQLASAGAKTGTTAKNLRDLGEALKSVINNVKGAGNVSESVIRFTQALSGLANAGSHTGSAGRTLNNAFNSVSTSANRSLHVTNKLGQKIKNVLTPSFLSAKKSGKSLASTIGLLYAKFWVLQRAVQGVFKAIGSAQDYVEDFNYFAVALNKIGTESADKWKKNGYNSATEYANSFRGRFKSLQKQMTGYDVNSNTGELYFNIGKNLGLNISEVMDFQANIAQVTNSAGVLGENSMVIAEGLSMISADLASLRNEDFSTTANSIKSGIIGNSRVLYKYGIDTTKAGLAQTALNHGLNVNVTNLSQASKMQLRYLTILEQSRVAMGDLGNTINQPNNQLRMMQSNFKSLVQMIGALVIPIVSKLYPYINALLMVLKEFVQWLGKLAGVKIGAGQDYTIDSDSLSQPAADSKKLEDNTKKTEKATKKIADNLQGFDKINKLTSDSSNDPSSKVNTPNASDIDLSNDLAKALANYRKIWNEAFKSNKNKAVQYAEKIKKAFLNAWKTGDFTKVGATFGNWINKGLRKIKFNKINGIMTKIAKSVATFLNGAIGKTDWKLVGKSISKSLNTAVNTAYTFFTKFKWLKFGTSLGKGINSAIKTFNAKKFGKMLSAKLRGMIQFAFGLLTTINYKKFGDKIANTINSFFTDMAKTRKNTGLTGWQELGKSISSGIGGFLDSIITALSKIKWEEVGKAIGQFLAELKYAELLSKAKTAIITAIKGLIKSAFYALKENPIEFMKTVKAIFETIFILKLPAMLLGLKSGLTSILMTFIKNAIMQKMLQKTIMDAFANQFGTSMSGGLQKALPSVQKSSELSKFGKGIGTAIGALVAVGIVSKLGSAVTNSLVKDSDLFDKSDMKLTAGGTTKFYFDLLSRNLSGDFTSPEELEDEYYKKYQKATNKSTEAKRKKEYDIHAKYLKLTKKEYKKYIKSVTHFQEEAYKAGFNATYVKTTLSKYESKVKKGTVKVSDLWKKFNQEISNSVSGKSYETQSKLLKRHLDEIKVSADNQNKVIKILNDSVKKGTINYKDYEKITGTTFSSMKDLYGVLKNVGGKEFATKLVAEAIGAEDVSDVDYLLSKNDGKVYKANFYVKADTKEVKNPLLKLYRDKKLKNFKINVTPNMNSVNTAYKQIKNKFQTPFSINFNAKSKNASSERLTALANLGKMIKNLQGTAAMKKVPKLENGTLYIPKGTEVTFQKMIDYAKKMKIPIKKYARGGVLEDGLFTMNKGEIAGKFNNNKSVVANNKTIQDGFAKSVTSTLAPAIYSAVKQAFTESGESNSQPTNIYLDGKLITKNVVANAKRMKSSTGKNPLVTLTT